MLKNLDFLFLHEPKFMQNQIVNEEKKDKDDEIKNDSIFKDEIIENSEVKMIWNDVKIGMPTVEGRYLVYKYYPFQDKFEVCIEVFKSISKLQYTTDNKQVLYKKFKFENTGKEPEQVKFWMNIPEVPTMS
jgi:hypothetical protein